MVFSHKRSNRKIAGEPLQKSKLLFLRFLLLFAFSAALGILSVRADSSLSSSGIEIESLLLMSSNRLLDVIYSSRREMITLVAAALSAFTFFCPTVLHLFPFIWGYIYGVCACVLSAASALDTAPSQYATVFFAISAFAFAVAYSYLAAKALYFNKCFIRNARSTSCVYFYVSKDVVKWLLSLFIAIGSYIFIRITCRATLALLT